GAGRGAGRRGAGAAPPRGRRGAGGAAGAGARAGAGAGVRAAARRIAVARPTAVNLAWGVDRALDSWKTGGAGAALAEAERIAAEDVAAHPALRGFRAGLLPARAPRLTHLHPRAFATP